MFLINKFWMLISSTFFRIKNPKQRKFLMEKLSELSDFVVKERIGVFLGEYSSEYGLSEACSDVVEEIEYLYEDCVKYGLQKRIELLMDYHLETHFDFVIESDCSDDMWYYFGKELYCHTPNLILYLQHGQPIKAYKRK